MGKARPKASPQKGHKIKASSVASVSQQDVAERQVMIAEAAYFIAEHRGFTAGDELSDWLQAEREVQPSAQQL